MHLKCFYRTNDLCWGVFVKEEKYVKMLEREKLITNLSLTLLSVANKFDIIVLWKSNEYIYFVKLNVINLTCTDRMSPIKHLFAL